MAAAPKGNAKSNKQNNAPISIEILLDSEQPYKEFEKSNDTTSRNMPNDDKLKRIQGSLMGLAIGDALGAPVEFRPRSYLLEHEVKDMQSGGTWGLEEGQWTDDTSMTLCLAASLIVRGKFDAYDQFERYKRWFENGYMSSTGTCFDIGKSTRQAISDFSKMQDKVRRDLIQKQKIKPEEVSDEMIRNEYLKVNSKVEHGLEESAGNGALMRLAPIPAFFHNSDKDVNSCIDQATKLTHGDQRAIDACRFYAALIWHALKGCQKEQLLDPRFHQTLNITPELKEIVKEAYQSKKGYDDGIRGKGFVLDSLKAALWAFYHDEGSFEKGVLKCVNLGDDTDTTAAIYGQLAGAHYGIDKIPKHWREKLFAGNFIMALATALYTKGPTNTNTVGKSDWSVDGNSNPFLHDFFLKKKAI